MAAKKSRRQALLDRVLVGLVLLGLWELVSLMAGAYWVTSPWQTLLGVYDMLQSGVLARNMIYTLQEAVLGFVIGGVPAMVLPFMLRRSPVLMAILEPYLVAGYGIPKLALAPLFIVWFGIGIGSKLAIVVAITFFLIFFNVLAGVRALDVRLVRMAQIVGASESQVAHKIIWPGAVPYIFAGIRTATPYAIGGAVIAELISSNRGLGYLVQLSAMNFDNKTMFAALAAITAIVVIFNWIVTVIERRLLRWRPTTGFATGRNIQDD